METIDALRAFFEMGEVSPNPSFRLNQLPYQYLPKCRVRYC
jgi:hypothetical protein